MTQNKRIKVVKEPPATPKRGVINSRYKRTRVNSDTKILKEKLIYNLR
jgi:hypothetical protein